MAGANVWERFPLDPREEQHARLRASDRDRDVVNDVLGTAYADGQLTPAELDERSGQVARSKTLGELPGLIDDLVVPTGALEPTRGPGPARRGPAAAPHVDHLTAHRLSGFHRAEAEMRYQRLRLATLIVFLLPTMICWVVWTSLQIGTQSLDYPWPIFPTLGTSIPLLLVLATHRDIVRSTEHRLERRDLRRGRREPPPPLPPQVPPRVPPQVPPAPPSAT